MDTAMTFQPSELMTVHDREVLRRLAAEVAEIAARPAEAEKRELWYRLNALQDVRPLVFCSPENGWGEIILQEHLECETAHSRNWEFHLRQEIFWGNEMADDRVVTGTFDVGYGHTQSDWGVQETYTHGANGGSYVWDAPVKDLGDLSHLRFPVIEVDYAANERLLNFARETFGDLLSVRQHQIWCCSVGLTWPLVRLRGLEQVLMDMSLEPDGLKALMAFLRDGHMALLQSVENQGLLHLNNAGDYVGSGGWGWSHELPQPDFDGTVRLKDLWILAESQETIGVSPKMFEEFVFPYQLPLIEMFGLSCYGCCEPIDNRWHLVKTIPNLRRVSVSPWSDVEVMAQNLQDKYIFSMKPNPAMLAGENFDEDFIRQDLRTKLEQAKGCRVEIIMKDNHTIGGDPTRVKRWSRIAREEADRVWDG